MAHTSTPSIERIVETALYVDDLSRARAFYVETFGFEVLLESARLVALSVGGTSVLLLFQRGATAEPLPTSGGVVPPHGATGPQHFAFAIPATALEPWLARLEELGVSIESRVRWPRGGESVYLRDPHGHSVELMTPGLWRIS
jgi:catechol 2,3-dioxygenase-like lactoylglutathione lyase family enzyme